jgi:DNA-binding NtrC family response regulator
MVGRVAGSDAAVMVTGESGAGKELVACAIHNYSARSNRSFLAINCAGSQTTSSRANSSAMKRARSPARPHSASDASKSNASKGTLFLDEIGEMPLQVQSKILRVLQEGEFSRVGGNETLHTDVRIEILPRIKTSRMKSQKRKHTEDLFYRLNVVRIHIPPLREHVEDIRLIRRCSSKDREPQTHARPLNSPRRRCAVLESYPWPGNVRELENTLQRAAVLPQPTSFCRRTSRSVPLLPKPRSATMPHRSTSCRRNAPLRSFSRPPAKTPRPAAAAMDRAGIHLRAMQKTGDNQVRAAKLLGITAPHSKTSRPQHRRRTGRGRGVKELR